MKTRSTEPAHASRHQASRDHRGPAWGQHAQVAKDHRPEMDQQQGLVQLMATSPRLQRQCNCGSPSAGGGSCVACEAKGAGQRTMLLQKKLTIGAPDDPLEREADQVMRMLHQPVANGEMLQTKISSTSASLPQHEQKIIGIVTVTTSELNVRQSPGLSSRKLGTLSQGEKVKMTGRNGEWLQILYMGKQAFIHGNYTDIGLGTTTGATSTPSASSTTASTTAPTPTTSTPAAPSAASAITTSRGTTKGLDERLLSFIADLNKSPIHGHKIKVTSGFRDPISDARAVLRNQKSDSGYYKIFSKNWQKAILAAIHSRDLSRPGDFDAAVNSIAEWITADPSRSPHGLGKAVDFGLAGGDDSFKTFIKAEAEKRGFKFTDETSKNHYHIAI